MAARAEIDEQQNGQFAFFDEACDVGLAHARADIPIDATNIVAGRIFADAHKFHAAAFEDRIGLARHQFLRNQARTEFDAAQTALEIRSDHYGTGVLERILSTSESVVISSASAS